jgi:hypothetical protein
MSRETMPSNLMSEMTWCLAHVVGRTMLGCACFRCKWANHWHGWVTVGTLNPVVWPLSWLVGIYKGKDRKGDRPVAFVFPVAHCFSSVAQGHTRENSLRTSRLHVNSNSPLDLILGSQQDQTDTHTLHTDGTWFFGLGLTSSPGGNCQCLPQSYKALHRNSLT